VCSIAAVATGATRSSTLSQRCSARAFAGDLQHLFGRVDADDGPVAADLVLKEGQAQTGPAAHVEDGVAALDR
jgi:hypothetical protein